jgi:hypothetical protein
MIERKIELRHDHEVGLHTVYTKRLFGAWSIYVHPILIIVSGIESEK